MSCRSIGSNRLIPSKATCYASSSRSFAHKICRSGHDYLDSPALRPLSRVTILKSRRERCENTLAKGKMVAAKSPEKRNGGRRYCHCTNVCFVAIWLWWGHYQTEACARETYRNGLEDKENNSMKISQWLPSLPPTMAKPSGTHQLLGFCSWPFPSIEKE